jgi:coenzyme F420-0:L-glutamate ligase / coenzyme F420-1:gamma-L-glutamate ligase
VIRVRIEAFTVDNVPRVKDGDDITDFLQNADLRDGDVVVIASTIVSKAEGLTQSLETFSPSERARTIAERLHEDPRFIEAVLGETIETLIEKPFFLVVSKFGQVCVNAGLDRSNVAEGFVLLLPHDPSENARQLRDRIKDRFGKNVAVIITDTCGRSFREGQTGVGIGFAGIAAMKDWRGVKDLEGKALEITNEGVGDEIAGLANLMMGEAAGGTPIVIVRGISYEDRDSPVFRSEETDIIRRAIRDANRQSKA